MRPFSKASLTTRRKVYNYRHSRARRYMECTFGIMCNKWRIFHRPLNVDLSLAEDIIKACCILHNYVRVRDGYNFEDTLTIDGFAYLQYDLASRGTRAAISIRDKFADYFVTPEGLVVPLSVAGGVLLWSIVNLQRLATCPPRIKVPSGMHG
ncbi:hypothetical protein Pcinc_001698 [Petrolisthes cinctipes]|uniref:DDE Tnp4 domain-containing protein n=1 Tax=Petrolisthes cinctipes TaxID=88211 RepID=A0AAE1GMB4_PETCI|nr:hypothetical protein Pcinc_001698 [Petrolisthes cinctipes]